MPPDLRKTRKDSENPSMKNIRSLTFAALLASAVSASAATPAAGGAVPAPPLKAESFYDVWIKDRLSLGLGVSWSVLTDSERPKDWNRQSTFLGYIWKLEDVDQVNVVPEIRYWAADYLRLTLSLDQVSGRTRNFNQQKHSDGVADLWGPQLIVEGLYPMCDDTVFLHGGLGVVYDFADFTEVNWWNLGYSSEAAWNERGRSGKTAQNYYREIHVDDAFGWTVAAGVSWRPDPRFEIDLSLRHTWIDPDCEFGYNYGRKKGFEKHSDGDFDLDHLSVVLTGSYVF
jgi:opacity protein-like surface antigen